MKTLRILLVENEQDDIDACNLAASLFNREEYKIEIIPCKSVNDVREEWEQYSKKLWNEKEHRFFDGAIIDLHLDDDNKNGIEVGGNEVAHKIENLLPKTPLVIRTGTPTALDSSLNHIKCLKRDVEEAEFENLFNWFLIIRKTGLTNIMSGGGEIESKMNAVFQRVLMPRIETWIKHANEENPGSLEQDTVHQFATASVSVNEQEKILKNVERGMLRYVLSHLFTLLDEDDEKYYAEEFYLSDLETSPQSKIRQGSLWKKDQTIFVVLTPACDLVIRQSGQCKTDRILLAEIDPINRYCYPKFLDRMKKRDPAFDENLFIRKFLLNTYAPYLHWVPSFYPDIEQGGLINFRKLVSLKASDLFNQYQNLNIHISHHFIKDITSRMSSYYARQGQPDLNISSHLNQYVEQLTHQESSEEAAAP